MKALSPPAGLAMLVAVLTFTACGTAGPSSDIERTGLPRERAWAPDEEPRAVILALHGFNDYSNAFAGFGQAAATEGIAVYAYDQRGFGANGDAGFWAGTEALTDAVERRIGALRDRHPDLPFFLLGESMGAAVAIAALARPDPPPVDGVILSAPAVWGGEQFSDLYRAGLWLAVRLAPDLRLSGEGLQRQASDNIEMLRDLGRDPLVIKETRVAAIAGLVALMDVAHGAAPALDAPLLILGGEHDEIVPPEALTALLERVETTPCTGIIYPEGWHLLLRDNQRQTVYADVLAWIDGARPPSGRARPCGGGVTRDAAWQQ